MKQNRPTFAYIGSDGGLEVYDDPYFEVTPESVEQAKMYEDQIIQTRDDLARNFVKLGYYLDEFQRNKLYKAKGYTSLNQWLRSPEVGIAPSTARQVIQIKRQIIPLLMQKLEVTEEDAIGISIAAGITKLIKILPLIPLGYTDEAVVLAQESNQLTTYDVDLKVKSLKLGREMEIDETFPAMFRGSIRKGETFSRIKVDMINGVTIENCGTLTIRNIFLQRFTDRFGDLIRFENEETS